MKTLLKVLVPSVLMSLVGFSAHAEQILLQCSISAATMRDANKIVIADTSNGLVRREYNRKGLISEGSITEKQWSSKNIRLANDRNGFRYLRYTYSEMFREFDWFVIGTGAGYKSEGRANCR